MCGLLMKFVVKFKIVFIVDFHILLVFVIIQCKNFVLLWCDKDIV